MKKNVLKSIRTIGVALIVILSREHAVGQASPDVEIQAVSFWSEGVRLQADLYKPKNLQASEKLPGVLLVGGWGGNKGNLRRAYGPQFAKLGFIVLAFDYKGWGESDGLLLSSQVLGAIDESAELSVKATHIRNIVNPISMVADARAALQYLTSEPQVIEDTIGIWGTSLGGGVALVTAANDERIKAYVDQLGAVNFKANLDKITDDMVRDWEQARARGKLAPYPGPESAIIPGLNGYPDWIYMKRFDAFSYVDRIKVPTLIIDAEDEELFAREKNGQLLYQTLKGRVETKYVIYPGKHYDLYKGEQYKGALKDAQQWFVEHLRAGKKYTP